VDPQEFERYLEQLLKKLGLSRVKGSYEDQWIQSGDITLYAPVFPAGEGKPTVVFIPGTSVYALCYAELLYGLFQAGFNVVGFDPRGQGRSGGFRGDYTVMEHVADAKAAAAYARERFRGKVFVMGSSQGGIEAFYLAATEDPGVEGVICHNMADLADPDSARLSRFGDGVKAGRGISMKASRAMMQLVRMQAKLFPTARVPIATYLDLKSEPMRVFGDAWTFIKQDPLALTAITLRAMASLADAPLPRPVEEIETPVLVLHSSGDHIFPQDYIMKLYQRMRCDKEMKIYQDLPHLITIEHVPRVLPDVVEWIKRKSE